MILRADSFNPQMLGNAVSLRCPGCRQRGIFETMGIQDGVEFTKEVLKAVYQ